jgi:secondary thiamine-phosphate synthase enzyme
MQEIHLKTNSSAAMVDISHQVKSVTAQSGITEGLVVVSVPHTTAGITINENADPDVVRDMLADLDRLVPQQQEYYQHYEGNSAAHMKAVLTGFSVTLPLSAGKLVLGTWQGIYFCEFDGPRARRVTVQVIGSAV